MSLPLLDLGSVRPVPLTSFHNIIALANGERHDHDITLIVYALKDAWRRRGKGHLATSLVAFSVLAAGIVPAYAQYKEKPVSNAKIEYVHCTPQKDSESGEGFSMGEVLSTLGVVGQLSDDPKNQKLGVIYSTLGTIKSQKEIAREGRSNITVNQNEQSEQPNKILYLPAPGCTWINPEDSGDFHVKKEWMNAFAASSYKDHNKNGYVELSEFSGINGISGIFTDSDPLVFALFNPKGKNKRISKQPIHFELYYLPTKVKVDENTWNDQEYTSVYLGGVLSNGENWSRAYQQF